MPGSRTPSAGKTTFACLRNIGCCNIPVTLIIEAGYEIEPEESGVCVVLTLSSSVASKVNGCLASAG